VAEGEDFPVDTDESEEAALGEPGPALTVGAVEALARRDEIGRLRHLATGVGDVEGD
jgi:hypothetical protein